MAEVRVPTPRGELPAYLATPTGRGRGRVLVIHDFAGLGSRRASTGSPLRCVHWPADRPGLVNRKEVGAMRWDLGLQGLGLLIAMSLGFGVVAQLVVGRVTTRWLWLIAAAGYFVGGLFISEVWFGWATQEELQPNIDGLSFDEVLLLGLVPGIVTVLITRSMMFLSCGGRTCPPVLQ